MEEAGVNLEEEVEEEEAIDVVEVEACEEPHDLHNKKM